MPFITGDRETPFQARLARSLLIVEAGFGLMFMLVLLLVAVASPPGSEVTTTSGVGSGPSGYAAILVLFVVAIGYGWVGVRVGRLNSWARWAALVLQVPWLALAINNLRLQDPRQAFLPSLLSLGIVLLLTLNHIGATFSAGLAAQPAATVWVPPGPGGRAPAGPGAAVSPMAVSGREIRPEAAGTETPLSESENPEESGAPRA